MELPRICDACGGYCFREPLSAPRGPVEAQAKPRRQPLQMRILSSDKRSDGALRLTSPTIPVLLEREANTSFLLQRL